MTRKPVRTLLWTGSVEETALGPVQIACTPAGLAAVEIGAQASDFARHWSQRLGAMVLQDPAHTGAAVVQIRAYLLGELWDFTLPIDWGLLSTFQARALRIAASIPYGEVTTYGDIAVRLGASRAARAVGRAMATNPMPLVLPCHRVIGADGGLHGYGAPGGVETKAWLLALEKSGASSPHASVAPPAFVRA